MMTDVVGNMIDNDTSIKPELVRHVCDKCGDVMNWEWVDRNGFIGGNCPICGDDLCGHCAGDWNAMDECAKCAERIRAEDTAKATAETIAEAWSKLAEQIKAGAEVPDYIRELFTNRKNPFMDAIYSFIRS